MPSTAPSILVVDHTSYLQDRLGAALESMGVGFQVVTSASACLDWLRDEDVDGVLTSYGLVDLDGVRLLRSIRVTHPNLPVILAPEHGSETITADAIEAGITSYISHDVDPESVVSRERESLEQSAPWVDEENAKRYHHLLEVSPVPINLFDATGESIWCNQAVLDLLGLASRDELIGNPIFDFIHPADHELAQREIEQVTAQKESVGPTEMKLLRKDGSLRHLCFNGDRAVSRRRHRPGHCD